MAAHYEIYIVHRGKQAGPFSLAQLRQQIAAGNISRTELAWFQGAGEWTALNELFPDGLEIEDAPPRPSATGLSLVKEDLVPPPLPAASSGGWMGPASGGGKLWVPGKEAHKEAHEKTHDETLSTPMWEKQEAKRLQRGSGKFVPVAGRLIVIIILMALVYWVFRYG